VVHSCTSWHVLDQQGAKPLPTPLKRGPGALAADSKTATYRLGEPASLFSCRSLPRGGFEIDVIPIELGDRFAKRDAEIDNALAKRLADKSELAGPNIAELRARLATEKRTRKQKDLSRDKLWALWSARLSQAELELLCKLTKYVSRDRADTSCKAKDKISGGKARSERGQRARVRAYSMTFRRPDASRKVWPRIGRAVCD